MSAFIVSDLHIFTIASFAANRLADSDTYIDRESFTQELANRLKRANIESVNYRYSHHTKTPRTKCKPRPVIITAPAQVCKLVGCWNYQTCENSNAVDFHALSALLEQLFTPAEKEAAKGLQLWSI